MKNYVCSGKSLPYTNASGAKINSGDVVPFTDRIGVAAGDIEDQSEGVLETAGVFLLKKKSTDVVAQCAKLYWDNTAKELTTTSTANVYAGTAYKAAGNGVTEVACKLHQA